MNKIFSFLIILFCSVLIQSCITTPTQPVEPKVIYIEKPLKDPLPHPVMPVLDTETITMESVMEYTILLNGAVQKLQLLVEIYEREDRKLPDGYSNKVYENMTLDQLKQEYMKLLGLSNGSNPSPSPEVYKIVK